MVKGLRPKRRASYFRIYKGRIKKFVELLIKHQILIKMEKQSYIYTIKNYVRLNWFKLTLLGLLVFVFLRKDLSFQFHLNNPTPMEELLPSEAEQAPKEKVEKKTEILTQHKKAIPEKAKSQTYLSSVELPFFGSSTPAPKAATEIPQVDRATQQNYIKRFGHVAVSESKKYGIPASIILANGILHSVYGQRNLTLHGNNHFGIPCAGEWAGERANYGNVCYRHYENAWASFRDHSLYLTSGNFAELRQLSAGNYRAWAQGLERLAYSDIYSDLATRLIELIETEELEGFDMR